MRSIDVNRIIGLFANVVGFIFVALGISQSIFINLVDRSLWLDEAMFSYSFSQRSLLTLTKTVFEWDQSAPVIYLYLCKVITIVFGNSEFTLRVLSLISFCLTILLVYLISHQCFKIKYPIMCAAFVANIEYMLRYSNEFKSYMFETMISLSLFYIYSLYKKNKITWTFLVVSFPLSIWCAHSACFLIGGILFFELTSSFYKKNKQLTLQFMYISASVSISFVIYYFYWLQPTATSDFMQKTLESYFFPLFPKSLRDINLAKSQIENLFIMYFRSINIVIAILFGISIIKGIYKRNIYIIILIFFGLFLLFASFIHKFPLLPRMCIFIIPFISIVVYFFISSSLVKISSLSLIVMIILNSYIIKVQDYFVDSFVYRYNNELNFTITFIQQNIKNDEKVFVYHWAIPSLKYKIGYNTNKIGDTNHDNIIWNDYSPFIMPATKNNLDVLYCSKCYILSSYEINKLSKKYGGEYFYNLMDQMVDYGFIELVYTKYSTPLYFYTTNVSNLKQKVDYEILSIENSDGICTASIRIMNVGEAYIGGMEYYNIHLASKEREDIKVNLNLKQRGIAPGDSIDATVSFVWQPNEASVDLQLTNENRFWFEELGCTPLQIMRGQL